MMTDTVDSTELGRGAAAIFSPTLNAIFAPTKAFEALAQRPLLACWPILWVTVLMMALGAVNLDITRQIMRGMIEGMAQQGQKIDVEQVRTIVETMDKWAPVWATAFNSALHPRCRRFRGVDLDCCQHDGGIDQVLP